jgi:hypothetical protein
MTVEEFLRGITGPIQCHCQNFRDELLGPFNAIDRISHIYFWAHSIPLAEFLGKFLGPFNDSGRIPQRNYWAHSMPLAEFLINISRPIQCH